MKRWKVICGELLENNIVKKQNNIVADMEKEQQFPGVFFFLFRTIIEIKDLSGGGS